MNQGGRFKDFWNDISESLEYHQDDNCMFERNFERYKTILSISCESANKDHLEEADRLIALFRTESRDYRPQRYISNRFRTCLRLIASAIYVAIIFVFAFILISQKNQSINYTISMFCFLLVILVTIAVFSITIVGPILSKLSLRHRVARLKKWQAEAQEAINLSSKTASSE